MPKNIVKAIPIGIFDAATLTAAFQAIYAGDLITVRFGVYSGTTVVSLGQGGTFQGHLLTTVI